jgi:hypothetical protein
LQPPKIHRIIKIQTIPLPDFPIRLDGASKVALFAYDNNTFIVESYLPVATDVKVSVTGNFTQLRNLVTGEAIPGQAASEVHHRWQQNADAARTSFNIHLLPHSYAVFAAEK